MTGAYIGEMVRRSMEAVRSRLGAGTHFKEGAPIGL